jgi:AcrR family transcriptional regulator
VIEEDPINRDRRLPRRPDGRYIGTNSYTSPLTSEGYWVYDPAREVGDMFHSRRSEDESGPTQDQTASAATVVASAPHRDPRRRILDAMIETVARRGYDRTTVSRVLTSSGVQEAVFSEHFHDKHECFREAVDDLIGRAELAALECFQRDAPWHERVRDGLESLLSALARDPAGAQVALVEMLSAGPDARARQRSTLALFASLIEQGRAECPNGEHLPEQTSEAIVGGIASILHRRALQDNIAELPDLHAELTYFALLPYLEHERAMTVAGLREP